MYCDREIENIFIAEEWRELVRVILTRGSLWSDRINDFLKLVREGLEELPLYDFCTCHMVLGAISFDQYGELTVLADDESERDHAIHVHHRPVLPLLAEFLPDGGIVEADLNNDVFHFQLLPQVPIPVHDAIYPDYIIAVFPILLGNTEVRRIGITFSPRSGGDSSSC